MTGTRPRFALSMLLAAMTLAAPERPAADPVSGTWSELPPPIRRFHHAAIHDPVRSRTIVFGGSDGGVVFNDVWVLTRAGVPRWARLTPIGTPPESRMGHVAIYDPVRDRVVIWGGKKTLGTAPLMSDLWELRLSGTPEWAEVLQGVRPEARWGAGAIYDPVRDRMVMFGGANAASGGYLGDTWELAFTGPLQWSLLALGGGPSPRRHHATAYDPAGDRMIVFGGQDGTFLGDLWATSLSGPPAWSPLAANGTPPGPREAASLTYDPSGARMLLMLGLQANAAPPPVWNDLWELSLSGSPAWTQLSPGGSLPPGRFAHSATFDPADEAIVVFGGWGAGQRNDVWQLSLASTTWKEVLPVGAYPVAAREHQSVYDPLRQRMLMIPTLLPPVVRSLDLNGLSTWTEIAAAGPSPPARQWATAVLDPPRDRVLLIGGYPGPPEVWALSLSEPPTWSQIVPSGTTPPQMESVPAIHDPVRDRMVFHFGYGTGEVWALDLAGTPAWSLLNPSGTIPPVSRLGHTAIHDPVRDRMIIFGGNMARSDVWALNFSPGPAWVEILPPVAISPGRSQHTAIYDPLRDRMVVYAGASGFPLSDVWELSLAGTPTWAQLAPGGDAPIAREQHTSVYDAAWDRMVVYGGLRGGFTWGDVWELRWNEAAGTPPVGTPLMGLALHAVRVERAGTLRVTFSLPNGGPARLIVADVTGRRLFARELAGPTSGMQTLELGEAASLPSGIYFLRLSQGTVAATARAALIH